MASETHHHSSSDVLPSSSDEIRPVEDNQALNDDKLSAADKGDPDKASKIQHSLSDVSPLNAGEIAPAEDNLASNDDRKPTPAADNLASLDDKLTSAEDNVASVGKLTPIEDNLASDDDDKPTPAEDNLASVDKPAPTEDNLASQDDSKPAPAEDNLASHDDDKPAPAEDNLASNDDDKPAPAEDNLASHDDDKPAPAEYNLDSPDDDKPAPAEDNLASHDDNKPAPTKENLASLGDKPSAADEVDHASRDDPTPAQDDPPSLDRHMPDEDNLISDKKPEEDPGMPSEIQHPSFDGLPAGASGSNEITPAETNLDSNDKPTPAGEDHASLGNLHEPERSKSAPILNAGKTENGVSSHRNNIQNLCSVIKEELKLMHDDPDTLKKYGIVVERELKEANEELKKLEEFFEEITEGSFEHDKERKEMQEELAKLKKRVTKLKAKFPSKAKIHLLEKELKKDEDSREDSHRTSKFGERNKPKLPSLYKSATFEESETFRDFRSLYDALNNHEKKLCLLCFAVLPEDAKIKKRVMILWWIAEGFIASGEVGHQFLDEFKDKGFIIPVPEKPGFEAHSYMVHPLARAVLIFLAEMARFFDFNDKGFPTELYSSSLRACLVGNGLSEITHLEKMHMLFNVNETILEFKPEWFPKMENINILYLGRWQSEEQHHIEIEDPEFLESLQHLTYLKFLSLQGVSRVTELPDSIKKLGRLMILDLRACHNLEGIPAGIGSLKNLRYLDMSDCYLIDHMPKELSLLENLFVLKGFVVGDPKERKEKKSCTLKDLANKLKKLNKLSIYTGVLDFPSDNDLKALQEFIVLESLTIAWGSASSEKIDTSVKEVNDVTPKSDNNVPQIQGITGGDNKKTLVRKATKVKFDVASTEKAIDTGKSAVTEKKNQENVRNEQVQEESKTSSAMDETRDRKEKKPSIARTITRSGSILGKFHLRPTSNETIRPFLPKTLKKLDLKCYPQLFSPHWLKPDKLKKLKKLYIRGGKLRDLGKVYDWEHDEPRLTNNRWEVEILRLKFLEEMEIRWKDLSHLFPKLTYLEKVNCPKLTLFPCDGSGVWIDKMKVQEKEKTKGRSTT